MKPHSPERCASTQRRTSSTTTPRPRLIFLSPAVPFSTPSRLRDGSESKSEDGSCSSIPKTSCCRSCAGIARAVRSQAANGATCLALCGSKARGWIAPTSRHSRDPWRRRPARTCVEVSDLLTGCMPNATHACARQREWGRRHGSASAAEDRYSLNRSNSSESKRD